MSSERYHEVKDIFLSICDLAPEDRDRALDARCGDDPELRAEVERMLGLDAASIAQRLDTPPLAGALGGAPSFGAASLPDQIGRYKITREIGRGGMGVVYEARQENPSRSVALKVLHHAYAGGKVLRRFELEAHLLGQLEHPGIARVYEAGSVESAGTTLPFIAMELIDGPSLVNYANTHGLGAPERLELLARVCDAIHHAHQRGVIHRDLKPANILVATSHATTRTDARFAGLGQPKVLDFGVARAAGLETQVTTIQTGEAQLIGTVAYMSPEQVAGDPSKIDIRSDVYALGVVLFELLTGRLPHDLASCTMFEAVRRIREDEPDRAATLDRALRGDIDTIVSKALEREVGRRYQSAAELADDLRRYLNSEPIVARRASTVYQFRKFARRNKALVTGVAVAFIGMAAGTGVSVWKAVEATRQRNIMEEANRRSNAVLTFLNEDILRSAAPNRLGRDVTVRQAVDTAVMTIAARFDDDPAVESRVRHAAGQTYDQLGEPAKAREQFERSIELIEPLVPEHEEGLLSTKAALCRAMVSLGEVDEAERLAMRIREIAEREYGAKSGIYTYTTDALAAVYLQQDRIDDAIELTRQEIETLTRIHGEDSLDVLTVKSRLASAYVSAEQFELAEQANLDLAEELKRTLGPEHPTTLNTLSNLGALYLQQKRHEDAEAVYREVLPIEERVMGPDHPSTQVSRQNLAVIYNRTGRYELARPLMEKTLQDQIDQYGERHPNAIVGLTNLSLLYYNMKDHEAALEAAERGLPISREVIGPNHHVSIEYLYNIARPLRELGRLDEAIERYEDLIARTIETRGELHPRTMHFTRELSQLMIRTERYEEAETRLKYAEGLYEQMIEAGNPPIDAILRGIHRALGELYTAWGRPEDAARYVEPEAAAP
ncbi:MAG: tetratricopeptide repeat protein [Phycisphaerales bacterium JB059]